MKHLIHTLILATFFMNGNFLMGWDSFTYFPSMKILYHPVSTSDKDAQESFNKGLLAIYAFNYDEAVRSFDRASQLDPHLAMAFWGMALALDQSLDKTTTTIHAELTDYLCEKAVELSKNATEKEKAYIYALSKRFSKDPHADKSVLRAIYSNEMQKVMETYPDDLDARVLYAESLMDILSWDLWKPDGSPFPGVSEILKLLESVQKKDPFHIGANHYYIHAVEDSPNPEKGLWAAYQLDHLNLVEWGHLLHTTSHIYMRVGDYEKAVNANLKGIAADKKYIKKYGIEGRYPLKYLSHNLFYLTRAYLWQEKYEMSLASALELKNLVFAHVEDAPFLEFNLLMPLHVYLYFHKWDEILLIPKPSNKLELLFWTFARSIALASSGNIEKAKILQDVFFIQKEVYFKKVNNSFLQTMFDVAEDLSIATIAKAKGNLEESISRLKQAVEKQDQEGYLVWSYPLRQTWGARLMEADCPEEAERVFRDGLKHYPRNGRFLFGLYHALQIQKKFDYWTMREKNEALKFTHENLTLDRL